MSPYKSSPHHSFDVNLATQLGSIDLAILVHHMQYWINHNKRLGRNFKEGRTWMYQTREEMAAHFPYWSSYQLRRFTDRLVELGILIKGNFNKMKIDQTLWYAFEIEEMFTIGENAKSIDESANSIAESAKPIPNSKPNSLSSDSLDLGLQTGACDTERLETLDIAKRWKLNDDQKDAFDWLKSQNIDAEDKKLAYWAKTHPLQRLIDVFNESVYNKANSLRKYMSHLLDLNKPVMNANIQANSEFASEFGKNNGWGTLKIWKKYITFYIGKSKQEISLDMNPIDFINRLLLKHECAER